RLFQFREIDEGTRAVRPISAFVRRTTQYLCLGLGGRSHCASSGQGANRYDVVGSAHRGDRPSSCRLVAPPPAPQEILLRRLKLTICYKSDTFCIVRHQSLRESV